MCIIIRMHCTVSCVCIMPYCGIVGNTSHAYTVSYGGIKDNSNTWKSHAIPPPRLSIIYCDLSTLVSNMFRGIVEVSWIMKSVPAKMYPPAHSGEPTSNIAITVPAFNLSMVNQVLTHPQAQWSDWPSLSPCIWRINILIDALTILYLVTCFCALQCIFREILSNSSAMLQIHEKILSKYSD